MRFKGSVLVVFFAGLAPLLIGSLSPYESAKRKMEMISSERAPRGSTVQLTSAELNAYIKGEIPSLVGEGAVTRPHLVLGNNSGKMTANVDFAKVQAKSGRDPGWIMSTILSGERPVVVQGRIQSAKGRATIFLDQIEVSGIPINGAALDFLMDVFIRPRFPDIKIGEPFELAHGVERVEVKPEMVNVRIAR